MSLFGSSQSQSNSSLFNNQGGNQQPAENKGLFGSLGGAPQNTQASGTSNLFGATASAQSQQQPAQTGSSNLFGSLNQTSQPQQSSSGSLFGGFSLGASSQPATGAGGLFGTAPSTSGPNQQAASASGGLFGSANTGQTAQAPQNQPAQPGAASSLFGGSILSNPTGPTQQQAPVQPSQPTNNGPSTTTNAHFQTLLERGKKRREPGDGVQLGDLPSLQLSLGDISGRLKNLGGGGGVRTGRGVESRARDLLAASGVPRGSTQRDLNTFTASTGVPVPSVQQPPPETDINAYVANLRAKSTADLIKESLEETKREFDAFLEENIQINWEEQRQRVHEHFGIARPAEKSGSIDQLTPDTRGAFGKSSRGTKGRWDGDGTPSKASFGASRMSKSILGGTIGRGSIRATLFADIAERAGSSGLPSAVDDPFVRTKQEKYATKVRELNASRKEEKVYPVIEQFGRVETESGSDTPQHLVDAYRALKEITKEDSAAQDISDVGAVRERQYARDYLDENTNSGKSAAIRKQILDGSRKFLETSFFQHLEAVVAKNPREANLGGVPSKINKIRAYLRVRAARKDLGGDNSELQMLGDDYCWALIFHLLRCGLVTEAAQYVSENERAIKAMDRHFTQYMAAFARDSDRRLPRELQSKINAEYSQRVRLAPENSIDPYRMACYKIVGRCDLAHKSLEGVNTDLEDWLWVIFSLARETNRLEEAAAEDFGLQDVRGLIESIGARHFTSGGENNAGYATFFFMQILAGLFERAIAYLYPHNYVAAVHFAIALDFYGFLRVSDVASAESDLLTYTTRTNPQISFGRLLGYYTRDFRLARAEAAADYIVLICLNSDLPGNAGQSQATVCQEALKELVLETREFALLLGDINAHGEKIKGAIETRLPLITLDDQQDFLRRLTLQAASVADDSGRTTDAVLLNHLAEDYDKVIVIINRALSDALSVEIGQEPLRLQPLKPRVNPVESQQDGQRQFNKHVDYSLSLTSVDDPAVLARNMVDLYNAHALYFQKIKDVNRNACGQLLRMSSIRSHVEAGRTGQAIDEIIDLRIIPLRAEGNVSLIRSAAQNFNLLPQVVARNTGHLLMWAILCLGRERQNLMDSAFQANKQQADALLQAAKDLMVFAGLIRYKLPPNVFEVLARAGQNVGAY